MVLGRWLVFVGAMLLGACVGGEPASLVVDLRTDLRPGDDFVNIRVRLATETDPSSLRETVVPAPAGRDLTLGFRVTIFEELVVGSYVASLALEDAAGEEVASWRSSVPIGGHTAVTALVTRSCIGVTCPGAGDAPNQTACSGGQCVNEDCASGVSGACDRPDVPLSDFFGRIIPIACEMFERCTGSAFYSAVYKDVDCVEWGSVRTEDLVTPLVLASVVDGRLIYNPASGQACLDVLLVECRSSPISKENVECVTALQGTVALGGTCRTHFDCVGLNTFCDIGMACPGTCRERLSAGSVCLDTPSCEARLACFGGRCARPVEVGEACGSGVGPCVVTSLCARGTCQLIEGIYVGVTGDSCSVTEMCREPLSCSFIGAEQLCSGPAAGAGSPCYVGVPDPCPRGEYCAAAMAGVEGTCMPLPAAGEACLPRGAFVYARCAAGHVCDPAGGCVAVTRLGDRCDTDLQCSTANCDAGVCRNPCDDV